MTSWTAGQAAALERLRKAVQQVSSSLSPTVTPKHFTGAVGGDAERHDHRPRHDPVVAGGLDVAGVAEHAHNARSTRRRGSSSDGNNDPVRVLGIATSTSPAGVDTVRGRWPLR